MIWILPDCGLFHTNIQNSMTDHFLGRCMIVLMLLPFWSCHRTLIDRYSEDELVRIMLDAHTLGLIYNRQEDKTDSLKMEYYDVLEERYGLDRKEFQNLVDGLILNAELYDKVYSRMGDKVEKMEHRSLESGYGDQ